jgi:hypothetical protein
MSSSVPRTWVQGELITGTVRNEEAEAAGAVLVRMALSGQAVADALLAVGENLERLRAETDAGPALDPARPRRAIRLRKHT